MARGKETGKMTVHERLSVYSHDNIIGSDRSLAGTWGRSITDKTLLLAESGKLQESINHASSTIDCSLFPLFLDFFKLRLQTLHRLHGRLSRLAGGKNTMVTGHRSSFNLMHGLKELRPVRRMVGSIHTLY